MSNLQKHSLDDMVQAATLMLYQGKEQEAFDVCCIALRQKNPPRLVNLIMSQVAGKVTIKAYNPIIKDAMLQTLECYGIEAQLMAGAWVKMLYQDPTFDPLQAFFKFDYAYNPDEWKAFEPCIDDAFFIAGLKKIVIDDMKIEIALRNIRRILLQNLYPAGVLKTKHLEFICALAENCFSNEFIFYATDEEKAQVKALDLSDPFAIAIAACYESLDGKPVDQKASAVAGFKQLIKTHIKEPEEERALKSSIKALGAIGDEVSLKVQNMYEKNPYPRWRTLSVAAGTYDYETDIMVAGSGTGRYLVQSALMFPKSKFQAVDITRASIAYSMRMAKLYGANNIDFAQCDILDLHRLEKQFDFINCSGVLHHMGDPVAGWKSLIERLKPGGAMMIGLYSTKARKVIFEARDEIALQNIDSSDDGLRAFRHLVFSMPPGNKLDRLRTFKDFYTLSETRDLLFHVQEKTYDIPELQKIMDDLDLEFCGFKLPYREIGEIYKQDYPDDPDMLRLDYWDEFEKRNPDLFGAMYNFLCKKKGDTLNVNARNLIETGAFT